MRKTLLNFKRKSKIKLIERNSPQLFCINFISSELLKNLVSPEIETQHNKIFDQLQKLFQFGGEKFGCKPPLQIRHPAYSAEFSQPNRLSGIKCSSDTKNNLNCYELFL